MIKLADTLYQAVLPFALLTDAQIAHHQFIEVLRLADDQDWLVWLAAQIGKQTLPIEPVTVGGVRLKNRFILSAGMVKGDGFASEADAIHAVRTGDNIIPGWRALPKLVGAVEFGSFTRYPRVGNDGTVVWRDAATRSTQNRIGLKNPGVMAAAMFLHWHKKHLPPVYGINIAVSPGVDDPEQEEQDALESLAAFTTRDLKPSWFTLNLSCPNTEDDPLGNQTEAKAHRLCGALVEAAGDVPLWVKVSPCLSADQYAALMAAFAETGVKVVIATNTQAEPTPNGKNTAGVGGGRLHAAALDAVRHLAATKATHDYPVDVIGCGGVLDGTSYRAYRALEVAALQYYSAMIYRSPLAAAIIHAEAQL